MNEFVKQALEFIPWYLSTLLRLVVSPKKFVVQRISESDSTLKDGLIFWAISILIAWILSSTAAEVNNISGIAKSVVFSFLLLSAFGVALCIAFRLVNGRADLQKIAIIHLYYFSVLELLMAIAFILFIGAFRSFDPDFYKGFATAANGGNMPQFIEKFNGGNSSTMLFLAIFALVLVSSFCFWIYLGWGAYRELHQLPKWRSGLAFILYLLLCIPAVAVTLLIANGGVALNSTDSTGPSQKSAP